MSKYQFLTDLVQSKPWPIYKHVFVIGEIGINHNGDMSIAKQLVDMAKNAGCDAIKFQKRAIDVVYEEEMLSQSRESPWGNTQRAQKEGLEFGEKEYDKINAYCKMVGIDWFASAWDVESQVFMRRYNLKYNKIASAMTTHKSLLEEVASEKRLTFLSTGMCDWEQIDAAVEIFNKYDCPIVLMHTVSEYPAPEEALNLKMMQVMRDRYSVPVGYSGHEPSVSPSVIAATLGAVAVERHITLDRAMYGSDQSASLEQAGLLSMVNQIRKVAVVLGDGEKRITDVEKVVASKLRYWREE
jgi:N-acetylneuraminate synthase